MAWRDFFELRPHLRADGHDARTTRVKTATGRRVIGTGDIAGDDLPVFDPLLAWLHQWNGFDQCDGVRMCRPPPQVHIPRDFHNAAQIHHDDAMRDVLDHRKVVTDKEI